MLTEYKPNRSLGSLGLSQLEIPRVHAKQGESAFSYYAARSWNQLPEEIRCAKTLSTFKSRLKTHRFSCAFVEWALCYVPTDCMYNHSLFLTVLNSFKVHFYIIFYCCGYIHVFFIIACFDYYLYLFYLLLFKASWITTVYEMCYINKLPLPYGVMLSSVLLLLTKIASCTTFSNIFSRYKMKHLHIKNELDMLP